jgi:hypothetical protein
MGNCCPGSGQKQLLEVKVPEPARPPPVRTPNASNGTSGNSNRADQKAARKRGESFAEARLRNIADSQLKAAADLEDDDIFAYRYGDECVHRNRTHNRHRLTAPPGC